jgi:hypothetical protein
MVQLFISLAATLAQDANAVQDRVERRGVRLPVVGGTHVLESQAERRVAIGSRARMPCPHSALNASLTQRGNGVPPDESIATQYQNPFAHRIHFSRRCRTLANRPCLGHNRSVPICYPARRNT